MLVGLIFLSAPIFGYGDDDAARAEHLEKQVADLQNQVRWLYNRVKLLESAQQNPPPAPADHSDVYRNCLALLAKLPNDLQPVEGTGWDKLTSPKVAQWLSEQFLGDRLEWDLTIYSVDMHRPSTTSNSGRLPWKLEVTPRNETFKYRGLPFTQKLTGPIIQGQ